MGIDCDGLLAGHSGRCRGRWESDGGSASEHLLGIVTVSAKMRGRVIGRVLAPGLCLSRDLDPLLGVFLGHGDVRDLVPSLVAFLVLVHVRAHALDHGLDPGPGFSLSVFPPLFNLPLKSFLLWSDLNGVGLRIAFFLFSSFCRFLFVQISFISTSQSIAGVIFGFLSS